MTAYWGELYLRSTRPLLSRETTAREVAYLRGAFGEAPGPILDVGCGHGRHAAELPGVIGIDADRLSLLEREGRFPAIRADFRALPIRTAAAGGAYAWYSTLFIHDEPTHAAVLREVARALRPGARLVLHTVPYERLLASPVAEYEGALPDGSYVREHSHFDAKTGFDHGERSLTLPGGRVLSGRYSIRYYPLPELSNLLGTAGFTVRWAHGDLEGSPPNATSPDLIVGAERTHG